jgi:topoisomerase-4 subunit A
VEYPRFEISFGGKHKDRENEIIEVSEFIGIKSYKAKGKRLTSFMVENIQEIEPIIKKESEIPQEAIDDDEDDDPNLPPLTHDDPAQMKLEL